MLFIGIDLSLTGTGFIMLDGDCEIVESKLIKTDSKSEIEDRINYIYNSIYNFINKYEEDKFINIEGLSYNSKGSSIMQLAGLHYFVRINLNNNNLKYLITPPSTLKKFVSGKGNCKKDLILLNVYKHWGVEFDDNNLADAYCLSRMSRLHIALNPC